MNNAAKMRDRIDAMSNMTKSTKPVSGPVNGPKAGAVDAASLTVFDVVGHMVCLIRRGKVTYINGAGRRLLGIRSKKAALGITFSTLIFKSDKAVFRAAIEDPSLCDSPLDISLVKGKSKKIPVSVSIAQLADHSFLVNVWDMSEQKQAEADLVRKIGSLEQVAHENAAAVEQQVQRRQRAEHKSILADNILNSLGQAVAILDSNFRIGSINPAYTRVTGYTMKNAIGKPPSFDQAVAKDAALYAEMWRSLSAKGWWEGEFWNRRKDKSDYAEHLSVAAITDDAGQVKHYAAVINDVTQRKEDEERIR